MTKKNDAPDHYQIKFRNKGTMKWFFGVFYKPYSGDELKLWEKSRIVLIADAVLPFNHQCHYDNLVIVDIPLSDPKYNKKTGGFDPANDFEKYIVKEHEKAKAKAAKATGLQDKLFKVHVADGYACYVVTKENKKTVRVEWRGFAGGDRYTDRVLGWECTIDKERIADMIRQEESLKAMFGPK